MGFHQIIGIIAGVVAGASFIPYIHSILKGETKPNRATFLIWAVVDTLILASYFASGARETIWVALAANVFQGTVFLLSIKYGVGGFTKLDISCLVLAAIGIFMWVITKDPVAALYLYILIEFLGYLPVFKKSYLQPDSENSLAWVIAFAAGFINLFAVTALKPEILIYPIFLIVSNGLIVFLLLRPRLRD